MISNKSVQQTPPTELDPNFFLPPNVIDMRYVDTEEDADTELIRTDSGEVSQVSYDEVDPTEILGELEEASSDENAMLPTPDSLVLVSEQVRVTADGKFVVDLVLEVTDIVGTVNYEVRVTKV